MSLPDPGLEGIGSFCHYTTFAGFDGILRERKLWATDIQFLNDSQELKFAVSEVLKLIDLQISQTDEDETKKELSAMRTIFQGVGASSSYVVSFSAAPDTLSLWRAYSKS